MSIRDINWRRGLFRLWLLFSIPWVILLGYLTFNESKTYIERINIEKNVKALKQKMDNEKLPPKLKHGKYIKIVDIISDRDFLELPLNEQKKGLIELSKDFAKLNQDEQYYFLLALKTTDFSVHKGDFNLLLYITFLPPLLLLGIGTALYWAFRGFSPK